MESINKVCSLHVKFYKIGDSVVQETIFQNNNVLGIIGISDAVYVRNRRIVDLETLSRNKTQIISDIPINEFKEALQQFVDSQEVEVETCVCGCFESEHTKIQNVSNTCFGKCETNCLGFVPYSQPIDQIPDLSDGKVHTFEMGGLRVDFSMMGGVYHYDWHRPSPKEFDDILFDILAKRDTQTFKTIEEFYTAYQKLLDYKASQSKQSKFELEWKQVFPIEKVNNIKWKDTDSVMQGYYRGVEEMFEQLYKLEGLQVFEAKIWRKV